MDQIPDNKIEIETTRAKHKTDHENLLVPATPEEISKVELLLDIPIEELKSLSRGRIVEAMYIIDRMQLTEDPAIDKIFFPTDLSPEKLEIRTAAYGYILEVGTGYEAEIIEGVGTIDLHE
jgi:hypothetical protein